jgi:hypothetical protein
VDTETDPTVIRSIAVTAQDVVAAVETNRTTDREAVLRITPPFSGRMRARLHVRQSASQDATTGPEPVHVEPERLLEPDAPTYPRPAETEDALRADPDREYSVEAHREYHEATVESWREGVRESIASTATIETADGPHEIGVRVLG